MFLKNTDLVDTWISAPLHNKVSALHEFITTNHGNIYVERHKLLLTIQRFHCKIYKYWNECSRNRRCFEKKNPSGYPKLFLILIQ